MDDTRTATTTKECTIYSNWTVIVLEEVSTDSMLTLEPRKLASLGGCKTKANIGTGDFFSINERDVEISVVLIAHKL